MSDLRTLHRSLASGDVVTTPPFDDVKANARQLRARQAKSAVAVAAIILVLAGLRLAPAIDGTTRTRSVDSPPTTLTGAPNGEDKPPADGAPPATTDQPGGAAAPERGATSPPTPSTRYACSRKANGGATGEGVTENGIHILVSAFMDGPKKTVAEESVSAIKMVFDEVNKNGGICGRFLQMRVVNDYFGRGGARPDGFLAVLPAPLDPAFDSVLAARTLDQWKVPFVGGDGLSGLHHSSPWLWPVGPPIASLTRISVDEAYRAGARTFALVHDPEHVYGDEAAAAFEDYVARLPGAQVKAVQALDPDKTSYASEADAFAAACGSENAPTCDGVVMALLPDTATKWLQRDPPLGRLRTAAYPFLLNDSFARQCTTQIGGGCEGIWSWGGFTPPIEDFRSDPDVDRFADRFPEHNPFTAGGYVTAHVLVEALRRSGPDLSRDRLRQALDEMAYRSGLVSQLDWAPDNRVGNPWARAVRMEVSQGAFRKWLDAGTGWRRDPMSGHFPR